MTSTCSEEKGCVGPGCGTQSNFLLLPLNSHPAVHGDVFRWLDGLLVRLSPMDAASGEALQEILAVLKDTPSAGCRLRARLVALPILPVLGAMLTTRCGVRAETVCLVLWSM
jgi:hypothetical protein